MEILTSSAVLLPSSPVMYVWWNCGRSFVLRAVSMACRKWCKFGPIPLAVLERRLRRSLGFTAGVWKNVGVLSLGSM